jgi:hypothetical protein
MRAERYTDDAYADERSLTIKYDNLGFRNPPDLTDWDIVVVGDSFTELGFLPDEELFTDILARRLGKRVKNLGVCHTGPLTHLCYARDYGKSPSTKDAVLCFFEGNDLSDLREEHARLDRFKRTGQPEARTFKKQTSILRALRQILDRKPPTLAQNAFVRLGDQESGVTVKYTPPGRMQMQPEDRALLESTMREWGRSMTELGMRPWVVYMPCKRRILHGRLRFMPGAPQWLVRWEPSDLPQYVQSICSESGIGFIDAIPPLLREVDEGRMCYNFIKDTHLNAVGSRVVADLIADALRPSFTSAATRIPAATPR